ncbi:MAG: hypothetical protein AAFN77_20435 [Planctomycetota bacterium]
MNLFAIAELEDGYTIISCQENEAPADAAAREGGILVDVGPFESYESAVDALDELEENQVEENRE